MTLSPFLMHFVVFTICLLWPNRAAGSANASFSHLPINTLGMVSSYQSEAESAKVFRFINRKCDAGYRQQVIAKVDQFKSLLERIQEQSLEDAQVTAQRIIDLFHDLKLSGLFAFEGPRILQKWISVLLKRTGPISNWGNVSGPTELKLYGSVINNMTSQEQLEHSIKSVEEGFVAPTNNPEEGFVDLLIANSHRTFRDLLIPQSNDSEQDQHQRTHLMTSLLLHECLWERARDVVGLPSFDDLFSSMDCVGHHYDALKHLVETRGLILIHPLHHSADSTPSVTNWLGLRSDREILDLAPSWMNSALRTFPDAVRKRGTDDVSILWMIKTIERGGMGPELFYGIFCMLFQEGSELWVPKAFEVFKQSDISMFSEALQKFVKHAGDGRFKDSLEESMYGETDDTMIETQKNHYGRYFKIFGTAIDVITVPKLGRKTLDAKWGAVLSQITLNWINGNREVSMRLMLSNSRRLDMYYGDGEGRMNRENLIKIQEAFPWLMTDDLIDALLRMKAETTNSHVIQ